jgi:hypothetical protein
MASEVNITLFRGTAQTYNERMLFLLGNHHEYHRSLGFHSICLQNIPGPGILQMDREKKKKREKTQ